MKNIITSVLFFASVCCCYAVQLTPDQALKRVTKSSKVIKSSVGTKDSPKLVYTGEIADGKAAYYVFADDSGAMFVSADDVAQPLLGYTDSGDFVLENLPPQLEWLLEQYTAEIEWALDNDTVVSNYESGAAVYATTAKAAISPKLTTVWNQGIPFYNLCPTQNGKRTLTGCVATSTAQVMNYFEWPQSAVPAITHTWNGQTLTAPSVTFDWKNMLDSYNGSYNTTQANAVAQLMRSVGYAVKMDYGVSASGAYHSNVRIALSENFGYDPAITHLQKSNYTTEVWEQLLYDNILSVGPVIYDGSGANGGHSFVLDGYNGSGAFHINWGWGGHYDGYFVLTALNPGNMGPFNLNQTALLGIRRPRSSSDINSLYIGSDLPLSGKINGYTFTFDNGFWNKGCAPATFQLGFMFENVVSGEKQYEYSYSYSGKWDVNYGLYAYSCNVSDNLPNGIYRVYPVYKVDSSEWKLTKLINGTPQYLVVKKSVNGLSFTNENDIGIVVSSCRVVSSAYEVGETLECYVSLINSNKSAKTATIGAYLAKDKQGKEVSYSFSSITRSIPSMSENELKISGTLPDMDAGIYYLIFTHDGNQFYREEVSVHKQGIIVVNDVSLIPDQISLGRMSYVAIGATSSFITNKIVNFGVKLVPVDDVDISSSFVYGSQKVSMKPNEYNVIYINSTIPTNLELGDYDLVVYDVDNGTIFGTMAVEITLDLLANIIIDDIIVVSDDIYIGDLSYITIGETATINVGATSKFNFARSFNFGVKISPENESAMAYPFILGTTTVLMNPNEHTVFTVENTIPDNLAPGRYNLTVYGVDNGEVFKTMIVELESALSAIDLIDSDVSDKKVRLFNLQGVEVDTEYVVPGIYIRVSGDKVEKIVIR